LPGNTSPETKGWIGELYDADAGLQYLNARYYDPALGLFLQPDWFEVTKAGVGTNRFAYCGGDPINCSDTNGNVPDNWATKDKKKGYDSNGYTHEYSERDRQSEVTSYKSWNDRSHPHYADPMDENGPGEPGMPGDAYGNMGIQIDYTRGWGELSFKYDNPEHVFDYSFGGSGQVASGDAIFDVVTLGGTAAVRAGAKALYGLGAKNTGRYIGYVGVDPLTGSTRYVGQTSRTVAVRGAEHIASGPAKAALVYQEAARFATKIEARIWEQVQINRLGLSNLLNKRNEIAAKYWSGHGIDP
jgi:RHS repeat-associated protein